MDFELDIDALPLQLNVEANPPVLTLSWEFTLAFGFDETEGFFLYTFPGEVAPGQDAEMGITANFELTGLNVDAKLLYFLNLELKNAGIGRCNLISYYLSIFSRFLWLNNSPCNRVWCWYFC